MAIESINHPSFIVNPSDIEKTYQHLLGVKAQLQASVYLPGFWSELEPELLQHYFSAVEENINRIFCFFESTFAGQV